MNIFGIEVLEPTTTITDFILSGMSFYFGHVLFWGKYPSLNEKKFKRSWALMFLFLGIGSFLGGVSHGFAYLKEDYLYMNRTWPLTVLSIGVASYYLLLSIAIEYFPKYKSQIFLLAYAKMTAFLLLMFGYPEKYFGDFLTVNFSLVILDYAPVLVLLLVMNIIDYVKTKRIAAKAMIIGIALSICGTIIQTSGFSLHQHFNHNDIYHVFQMVAIYLMFRAVKLKLPRAI